MDKGIATELLCSVCDEVCKRGAQMKCCSIRASRSCAVLKINKTQKCWNEECGQEDISPSNDLKNDDLLRKAVEHFLKNGKMDPAHEKMLKKTGKKTTIGEDGHKKAKKSPVDVVEKFNQPCSYGEKCKRKACLFVHAKPTPADKKKAGEGRVKGSGKPATKSATLKKSANLKPATLKKSANLNKPCKYGGRCSNKICNFEHSPPSKANLKSAMLKKSAHLKPATLKKSAHLKPATLKKSAHLKPATLKKSANLNKPCKYGAGCSNKICNFEHSSPSKALDSAIFKLKKGIRPMGGDLRFILASKRAMSDGMRGSRGGLASMNMSLRKRERDNYGENAERLNFNLEQMLKMKEQLDSMMAYAMGPGWSLSGGRGGGYGSSYMGRSEGRMDGLSYMGRSEGRMDGLSYMGRSEGRMDGRSYMGRSEDRMDGRSYMARSEGRMDGRNWNRGYGGSSERYHF